MQSLKFNSKTIAISVLVVVLLMFSEALKPFLKLSSSLNFGLSYRDWHDVTDWLLVVGAFPLFIRFVQRRKIGVSPLWVFLACYSMLSLLWSVEVSLARWHSLCFIGFLAIAWDVERFLNPEALVLALRYACMIIIAWCLLYDFLFPQEAIFMWGNWKSVFGNNNYLGAVASMSFLVFLVGGIYCQGRVRYVNYLFLAGAVRLLVLAGSFTSWLGAGFGAVLVLLVLIIKHRLLSTKTMLIVLIGMGFVIVALMPALAAFEGKDIWSLSGRVPIWSAVLGVIDGRGITGFGMGNFWLYDHPNHYVLVESIRYASTHNGFLNVVVQLGWLALGVFFWIYAKSLYSLFLAYVETDEPKAEVLTLFVMLAWMGFANLTESFFFLHKNWFWLLSIIISVMALTKFAPSKSSEHAGVHS